MIERFLIGGDEHPPERRAHLENLLTGLERQDCPAAIVLRSTFLTALFGRLEAGLAMAQSVEPPSSFQRLTAGR